MNKKAEITSSQIYGAIKMIIGVAVVLIVLGIVVTACSFISKFNLDSGTDNTFKSLVKTINTMSGEDYNGENIKELHFTFVSADLAIVGFDVDSTSVVDPIEKDIINRPFECGEVGRDSCLVLCGFGDDVDENSCSGSNIVGGKVAVFKGKEISKDNFETLKLSTKNHPNGADFLLIRGERGFGKNQGVQDARIEKDGNTFYLIIKS